MIDDGRLLALLATLGVAGAAAARGSRGVVRAGRPTERFVFMEPFQLEETVELGGTGSGRFETRQRWNVDIPGKGRVHAINLHVRPERIEAIYDRKTKRVIFWSVQKWSMNAQIEVWTDSGTMLMTRNPRDESEHVPFSEDLPRLEALMDKLDHQGTT